jgi:hypothetical protein
MNFGKVHGVVVTPTLEKAYAKRNGPKRIFAYNVPCTYLVARETTFFHKILEPTVSTRRYFYEVIEEDKPCHLYIDLDVNLEQYPSIDVYQVKNMVCSHVEYGLKQMEFDIETILISDSSSPKKGSIHILYKIKNKLWANNAHVGAFMRSCMEKRVKHNPEDYHMWSLFVDMCVYSRNRLFRMTGCTKKHENRIKTVVGQRLNYQNWLNNLIQPMFIEGDIIETYEPDGSPAKYMGAKNKQMPSNYAPGMKDGLVDFVRDIAPVRGVHYSPRFRIWVVNLDKHTCVFKGGVHSKNTNYMIVNKRDGTYSFRCWCQKYEACRTGRTEKQPLPNEQRNAIVRYNNFQIQPRLASVASVPDGSVPG